jgi:hypothetical protein
LYVLDNQQPNFGHFLLPSPKAAELLICARGWSFLTETRTVLEENLPDQGIPTPVPTAGIFACNNI